MKVKARSLSCNRFGRNGGQFDFEVFPILRRVIHLQCSWRYGVPGNNDGLGNQLGCRGFRIEGPSYSIQAGLGKLVVVLKRIVLPYRVIVDENLQVLAYDECVEQLFVHHRKLRYDVVLPGIVDLENKMRGLVWLERLENVARPRESQLTNQLRFAC